MLERAPWQEKYIVCAKSEKNAIIKEGEKFRLDIYR
jgi:hypothetical protein